MVDRSDRNVLSQDLFAKRKLYIFFNVCKLESMIWSIFFWFNLHQNCSNILFEFVCKKKALTKQPSRFKIGTFAISLRHTYCWFSSLNLIELTPSCMIMIVSLTTSILLCWRHEVWGCYHQQVYKRFDKIMSFFMSSSFCWIFACFTLHCWYIEPRNREKSLTLIWQRFSCLLDEWIAKI